MLLLRAFPLRSLLSPVSLIRLQEIMSDPSYAGQTVCFTAVHIGNTGCNEADMESSKAWLDGIVIRSLSPLVRIRLTAATRPRSQSPELQLCSWEEAWARSLGTSAHPF